MELRRNVKPDTAVIDKVSQARLWQRHMAMGAIGGTPRGGVNRLALTPLDAKAQATLIEWARSRGFACFRDAIGNLHVRREGQDPSAAPVVTGSHLDTQPTGGKFDGAYGVLAGFEVLEALADANRATRRAIEVVAWMNEEGSRFQPGCMGSAVYVGAAPAQRMLDVCDGDGVSVASALAQLSRVSPLPAYPVDAARPLAYLEAHIEQGPRLENEGATIGVVTGIQGSRRMSVDVRGEEAHAGTTPRAVRRDAVSAAVAVIAALESAMHDAEDIVRFTVGRMEVHPNSPNTVPSLVRFSIDLRHPDADVLAKLGDAVGTIAAGAASRKRCTVEVTQLSNVRPTHFPDASISLVREAAHALGYRHIDMPSGAGHDAMYLARVCPTGMIFVPCLRGVSHNEAESAAAEDLVAGARVLAAALVTLADR
jgi:N-carbamoyl-L-amino-acid hydrolase